MNTDFDHAIETRPFESCNSDARANYLTALCLDLFSGRTENIDLKNSKLTDYSHLYIYRDNKLLIRPVDSDLPIMADLFQVPSFESGIYRCRVGLSGGSDSPKGSVVSAHFGTDIKGCEISASMYSKAARVFEISENTRDYRLIGKLKRYYEAVSGSRSVRIILDDNNHSHIIVDKSWNIIWTSLSNCPVRNAIKSFGLDDAKGLVQRLSQNDIPDNKLQDLENLKLSHITVLDSNYRIISIESRPIVADSDNDQLKVGVDFILALAEQIEFDFTSKKSEKNKELIRQIIATAGMIKNSLDTHPRTTHSVLQR